VHARRVASILSTGVAVQLERVRRVFNNTNIVIAGLDLRIDAGEFLAVLGPSGCGKSTLLRMIARLAEPDSGQIRMEPDEQRFQTAFVFQDANLLPWRNVLDNAALPLELMGEAKAKRHEKARAALKQVDLDEALDRYPAQLSGGMRMRVSLARALVTEPRLLLLDEPFAALDEITRFHLDVQLRELWQRRGMTVIFVTHSVSEAAFLANRAVVLARRGGTIRLDRTLELPAVRNNELRGDPRLGKEVRLLLGAIEE
jgi:NitT/TauT family transport system ATP-binding protein